MYRLSGYRINTSWFWVTGVFVFFLTIPVSYVLFQAAPWNGMVPDNHTLPVTWVVLVVVVALWVASGCFGWTVYSHRRGTVLYLMSVMLLFSTAVGILLSILIPDVLTDFFRGIRMFDWSGPIYGYV